MDQLLIGDIVRVIIFVLFGLAIGETAWIWRKYVRLVRGTRRLLPLHVAGVSFSMLGLQTVAVWQNIRHIGDPPGVYVPINLVLFSLVYLSLLSMRLHITTKTDTQDSLKPLVIDPNEFP